MSLEQKNKLCDTGKRDVKDNKGTFKLTTPWQKKEKEKQTQTKNSIQNTA